VSKEGTAMPQLRLYHNPRCSKSRGALEILSERGVDIDLIEYLDAPPTRGDLEGLLDALPDPPAELVRKDKNFKELGLDASAYETRDAVIELLLEHPILLQRPIAMLGDKAVIGRPSEKVLQLL
jgi:arsenate reductase (glutaredoxin)